MPDLGPPHPGKKTLVLDLDETLIYGKSVSHISAVCLNFVHHNDKCYVFNFQGDPDFVAIQRYMGEMELYVQKRPGVDEFLRKLAPHYEVLAAHFT